MSVQQNNKKGNKMNIKVIEYATEEKVNKKVYELENNGYVIIDIIFTHPTNNHYVSYVTIKYKLKRI